MVSLFQFHQHSLSGLLWKYFVPKCVYSTRNLSKSGNYNNSSAVSSNTTANLQCNKKNERGRYNALGIKMLSKSLHRQIFGREVGKDYQAKLEKTINSLLTHGLLKDLNDFTDPDIDFVMPKLRGRSLEEHFFMLGSEFSHPYKILADNFVAKDAEVYPEEFIMQSGWTKYSINCNEPPQKVKYPEDPILVFDVETSVTANNIPVMAVAFSSENWYSWVSPFLLNCSTPQKLGIHSLPGELPLNSFIPFGKRAKRPQLIVGHNVSFDRSYIAEEYNPQPGQRYFMDTLSLHQCVGGFATSQRKRAKTTRFYFKDLEDVYFEQVNLEKISSRTKERNAEWLECGAFDDLNSLAMFYLNQPTEKSTRDIFVSGSLKMIRDNFQKMMSYCAHDVLVTFAIFKRLWPLFLEHSPSPVSLAGILMLSKCYLPVNENWKSYVNSSDLIFSNYANELSSILKKCAVDTLKESLQCSSTQERNLWVKDLDWSTNLPRVKNYYISNQYGKSTKKAKKVTSNDPKKCEDWSDWESPDLIGTTSIRNASVWAVPKWYNKLIGGFDAIEKTGLSPDKIETKDRIVPAILKMSWNGWPIVYHRLLGWGYLLHAEAFTTNQINIMGEILSSENAMKWTPTCHIFDFKNFHALNLRTKNEFNMVTYDTGPDEVRGRFLLEYFFGIKAGPVDPQFLNDNQQPLRYDDFLNMLAFKLSSYDGYIFVPIPHPSGIKKTCGNPLARDYALHVLSGKMLPLCGEIGIRFYQLFLGSSYWQNNQDRIRKQIVGRFGNTLPNDYKNIPEQDSIGAIVPRLIPCGTITRRAVERTWLTASNPQQGMIGSEMKSAIQAPKGFVFVGADVDSEELWLASLLGDAAVGGFHGSTPFSYMNIAGKATTKTDLHSVTARAIGISRDSAKVINYSRLYGAGHKLAISQMLLSDSEISVKDAIIKACYLFNFTKGLKILKLNKQGLALLKVYQWKYPQASPLPPIITKKVFTKILKRLNISPLKINRYGAFVWKGGSESEIFNLIDQFTYVDFPRTPFLGAQMSNGLATFFTKNKFRPCKFNWTIQSSAVDFLHTFLVAVYWLFSLLRIPARTIICVHDEIRLMVHEENAIEAAFVLHIGNLLTRALFCEKVGINDLPQKNAFFESVEVDTIIRKKPNNKCITPSNPDGMVINSACVNGKSYTMSDCLNILGKEVFLNQNMR